MPNTKNQLVGIIPAAGKGTRLAPFPCPKELFPIGFQDYSINGVIEKRPKVISQYVLERMVVAGVKRIAIIIGKDKSDVMEFFGDGHRFGCKITYLYQESLTGMPAAINLAKAWIGESTVVFGMPDTIIEPFDTFQKLVENHLHSNADLTLGLFPTDAQKFGMVDFDTKGNVTHTIDKPKSSLLRYMWGCCVWSNSFTEAIDSFIQQSLGETKEQVLGDVFNCALNRKMNVRAMPFDDGKYIDIGTSAELANALSQYSID